jgi:hypothetical protein
VLWGLSYDTQLYIFRIAIWVVPLVLFFVVRLICRELQASDRIEEVREQAEQEAEQARRGVPGASAHPAG